MSSHRALFIFPRLCSRFSPLAQWSALNGCESLCARNLSVAHSGKGARDESITNEKGTSSTNNEVPVQNFKNERFPGPTRSERNDFFPTRRSRDWFSDDFDSMLGPFRSFIPRPFRHPLRQMQRWMNPYERNQPAESGPEDQLATNVRDMIYDFDSELLKPASLTLEEKENEYIAKIYLKGFQKTDLNLRMQDEYLIVNGSVTNEEFKDRKDAGKMQTYSSQSFSRVLNLPEDVDRSKIHAKFEENQLIIQLPKDSKKKHTIEIH